MFTHQIPTDRFLPAYHSHFPNVTNNYPVDVSIERKSWVTLYPTNHDSNFLKDSFVEFSVESEPGCFIDYSSFNIEFNLRLLNADDTPLPDDSTVIFTNGLIHALISSRKLFLNSQLVESDFQSNYTQYIQTITSKDDRYIKNHYRPMGYFPEKKIIKNTPVKDEFAGYESNIPSRQAFARQENIQLYGPLNLSVGKSDMVMIDRISARLHMEIADTAQLILKANDDANNYKIKIFSVKLHFKRITPFDKALLAFNKNLLSKNIQYNFERFILYKSSIAANQSQLFISQPFGNLIPNKLYILMTKQSASIGDSKKKCTIF